MPNKLATECIMSVMHMYFVFCKCASVHQPGNFELGQQPYNTHHLEDAPVYQEGKKDDRVALREIKDT